MRNQFLELRKQYIEKQFGKLNSVQKDAVFTNKGPLLILAGAGSGKTTVLVNRIANLVMFGDAYNSQEIYGTVTDEKLEQLKRCVQGDEVPNDELSSMLSVYATRPYNILAITFTNKAASELKTRLENMMGIAGKDVNAATFHSSCVRILRRDAEFLGYPKSFTIYDSDDTQRAMKAVYKQLSIDDKFLPVKAAINAIGRLKDKMISPSMARSDVGFDMKAKLVAQIYTAYAKKLKDAGAMDFDDLIYNTVKLLQENDTAREYYQNKFKYILVDEYQDTSIAQFKLIELLGIAHQNVCVVGDDDQSIYKFRGATIENILNFEQHFALAKVIRLEQNYRSTSNILNTANCVIKNNSNRKGKTLWTENGDGELVKHYTAGDEHDEASHIAKIIGEHVKKGGLLRDHAILYRMNAQSGPIETYFARAGIPYKIVGGQRFFDRKEIKDINSYISIVVNPKDDLRLRRIINEPSRKIGATTLENVQNIATREDTSMLDIISRVKSYPEITRASGALSAFYNIYEKLVKASEELPMEQFVSELIDITGYRQMLENSGEDGQTRLENIGQLISSVKTYADQKGAEASLQGFLEEVALISDIDSYDEGADVVVMMTMHSAKGLEFPYVFMVGLEDGIFPSELSKYSQEDLEEERRLCYVGVTRAKKELFMSSATQRMIFGQTKRNQPSRFIDEMNKDLIEEEVSRLAEYAKVQQQRRDDVMARGVTRESYSSHSTISAGYGSTKQPAAGSFAAFKNATAKPQSKDGKTFAIGDKVDHRVFGQGTVVKVTPVGNDTLVEVQFASTNKKMMANYAPLTKI